jgi:hypothetical protein
MALKDLDFKNVDWAAFAKSSLIRGSLVTIILGGAGLAGIAVTPDITTQLTNNVNTAVDAVIALGTVLVGIWNLFHRSVAQPETTKTIVPKKTDQPTPTT